MPYQSSWEAKTVVTKWTGLVTGEELLAFIKTGHAHPDFDGLCYSLHDFTECTGTAFSHSSIEELAAMDSAGAISNPHIKVAVVATRPDVLSVVRDYIGTELSPYPVRVFPDAEEARSWLGS